MEPTKKMRQIKRKNHSGGSLKRKRVAKKEVAVKNRRPKTKRKTPKRTTRPPRLPVILRKAAILR